MSMMIFDKIRRKFHLKFKFFVIRFTDDKIIRRMPPLFLLYGVFLSVNLINLDIYRSDMRKLLATMKALMSGGVSIDSVDKTTVSRAPGNVTELGHN